MLNQIQNLASHLSFALCALALSLLIQGCAIPNDALEGPKPSELYSAPTSSLGIKQRDALIFAGDSAWQAEVNSITFILHAHGATYREVNSKQIGSFTAEDFSHYNSLIVPGGNASTMTESISLETRSRLHEAVQMQGMNYLGFCAGAWVASTLNLIGSPTPQPNYLTKQGFEFAIANVTFPDGTQEPLLWYGGPITPNTLGGVIAKYPDGTPAISQIRSGKGLVIISGLHPTATRFILESLGLGTQEAIAPDLAWKLLNAAIQQKPLPAF